jgi:CRISPR/Cas system CSM-associated protein Csm4 (group 5 of RAMP superfamily)
MSLLDELTKEMVKERARKLFDPQAYGIPEDEYKPTIKTKNSGEMESQSRYNIVKELSDKKTELQTALQQRKENNEREKHNLSDRKERDLFENKRTREDQELNYKRIQSAIEAEDKFLVQYENSVLAQIKEIDSALSVLQNLSKNQESGDAKK